MNKEKSCEVTPKKFIVYLHENKINNKKYVGITSQTLTKRSKNGAGYKNCSYFYNAIQKYGWNNFNHSVLFTGLTREQACIKEKELINLYKTLEEDFNCEHKNVKPVKFWKCEDCGQIFHEDPNSSAIED